MSMGLDGIFQPSLQHWREYLDTERMRINVKPALGPGPQEGPVQVDLKTGTVVINVTALHHEEELREQRHDGLA